MHVNRPTPRNTVTKYSKDKKNLESSKRGDLSHINDPQ